MAATKGKRPYPERIAEIDDQITILMAKRERLELLHLAQRVRAAGLEPKARSLRALVDAGLMERAHDLATELRPIVEPKDDDGGP